MSVMGNLTLHGVSMQTGKIAMINFIVVLAQSGELGCWQKALVELEICQHLTDVYLLFVNTYLLCSHIRL